MLDNDCPDIIQTARRNHCVYDYLLCTDERIFKMFNSNEQILNFLSLYLLVLTYFVVWWIYRLYVGIGEVADTYGKIM